MLILICCITDGKWVEDDYYEDKGLEEATSKSFNAGDFVGDLPDPSMPVGKAARTYKAKVTEPVLV